MTLRQIVGPPPESNLQAVVDRAIWSGRQEVHLLPGEYRLSEPLILGKKDALTSLRLIGSGRCYAGEVGYGGTLLVADFVNGPIINFTGARNSSVEDLTIRGPYRDELIWKPRGPNLRDWPGTGDRYRPSVGVGVDCLGGYYSSLLTLRNVEVIGCEVGVATKTDGSDGNGDFLVLDDCQIWWCTYGISIGHTQARCLVMKNCRDITGLHTFLTNRTHGKQQGQVNGSISGCAFNTVERMNYLLQVYAQSVVYRSCYGELIGSLSQSPTLGTRSVVATKYVDCDFDLRLHPNGLIAEGGSIVLDGGIYTTHDIAVTDCPVEARGVKFRPGFYEASPTFSRSRKLAANFTRGIVPQLNSKTVSTKQDGVKTSAYFPDVETDFLIDNDDLLGPARRGRVVDKFDCVYSGETLRFSVGPPPREGHVVQCDRPGRTTWIVTKVSGQTATLERINNVGIPYDPAGNLYVIEPG